MRNLSCFKTRLQCITIKKSRFLTPEVPVLSVYFLRQSLAVTGFIQGATPLVFEGTTDNVHETTLAITVYNNIEVCKEGRESANHFYLEDLVSLLNCTDPTADRTITISGIPLIPDETGTIITTGSSNFVTSTMIVLSNDNWLLVCNLRHKILYTK